MKFQAFDVFLTFFFCQIVLKGGHYWFQFCFRCDFDFLGTSVRGLTFSCLFDSWFVVDGNASPVRMLFGVEKSFGILVSGDDEFLWRVVDYLRSHDIV